MAELPGPRRPATHPLDVVLSSDEAGLDRCKALPLLLMVCSLFRFDFCSRPTSRCVAAGSEYPQQRAWGSPLGSRATLFRPVPKLWLLLCERGLVRPNTHPHVFEDEAGPIHGNWSINPRVQAQEAFLLRTVSRRNGEIWGTSWTGLLKTAKSSQGAGNLVFGRVPSSWEGRGCQPWLDSHPQISRPGEAGERRRGGRHWGLWAPCSPLNPPLRVCQDAGSQAGGVSSDL